MSSEPSDEELELIRQKKLAELQNSSVDEQRGDRAQERLEAQKQALLRTILTTEARQRLTNIRMVRPEFAEQLELQLIQLAQTGRIRTPLNDDQLKETLRRMQSQKRDFTIRRIQVWPEINQLQGKKGLVQLARAADQFQLGQLRKLGEELDQLQREDIGEELS